MDSSNEIRVFVRKVQMMTLATGFALGSILMLTVSQNVGLGLIAGVMVSVVNFSLMATDAFTIGQKSPEKARKFALGRYVLRYGIMFGFLALVSKRTNLNVIAAFVGLFFVQLHLFFFQIVQAKMNGKK